MVLVTRLASQPQHGMLLGWFADKKLFMKETEQLHDLCRLRSTLEAFAVKHWRKNTDRQETGKKLRNILDRLRKLATRGDYPAFHQVDNELHRTLVSSVNLSSLLKCWELVASDLDAWILQVKEQYWPNLMALYREHVLLLDAWQSDDDWVAEQATHQHLEAGWYRIAAMRGKYAPEIDPVERAVAFISTHFASNIEIEWVARHVSFLSVSHLNRLFKERTGVSPHHFLKQVRLDRAAQILRSSPASVSDIARRTGYRNTSHFVRDFRKKFRTTPLVYRRTQDV